jgi:hypothetical protein
MRASPQQLPLKLQAVPPPLLAGRKRQTDSQFWAFAAVLPLVDQKRQKRWPFDY